MKKILTIACLLSILLSSCANSQLTEKHYNENRECSLQLLLEGSVDTVFRGMSENILKVSPRLANSFEEFVERLINDEAETYSVTDIINMIEQDKL